MVAIMGWMMAAFGKVGSIVFSALKSAGPPVAVFMKKFLIFCLKSSIVLVFFLMGGSIFMFLGMFYIYYKLFKKLKKKIQNEAGFYKDSSVDADSVGPLPGSDSG